LDSFSVHHQESSTVHTAIGVCHTGYSDCLLAGSGCSIQILLASSQYNMYDIYLLLCVQCWTPDDGQRNCPKHVHFYSKNKSDKLVHLSGFIIKMYKTYVGSTAIIWHVITQICKEKCTNTYRGLPRKVSSYNV